LHFAANRDEAQKTAAHPRAERMQMEKDSAHNAQLLADIATRRVVPLHMTAFAEDLAKHLPRDAIILDEGTNELGHTHKLSPTRNLGLFLPMFRTA
jgi:benzoylformate decarboxylase